MRKLVGHGANSARRYWFAATAALSAPLYVAQAALPAEISTFMTDVSGLWDDVKAFIIGVVIFILLIGVVKLIRKK